MKRIIATLIVLLLMTGCSINKNRELYQGNLEADKIKLSAKSSGTIISFANNEGDTIKKGTILVKIEQDKLQTQLEQKQAQLKSMNWNIQSAKAQKQQIELQLKLQEDLLSKTERMLIEGAVTIQSKDDLSTQVLVLKAKVSEANSKIEAMLSDKQQINSAISLIALQIKDTIISSPINATILNKYFSEGEMVSAGSILLEIADLTNMEAKIYVPLNKLSKIKLAQTVTIEIDGINKSLSGKITNISSEAEFTPKTILTKETRTTLVYAVTIKIINNEGIMKTGMPVEVIINELK